MTLRVLLVGLGQVAMGYDLDSHDADLVLTHAKAFSLHPDFALQGGVDPDAARCAVFEERYGGQAGTDLVAALAAAQPDVVVVASPTPHHGTAVRTILEHGAPKLILCEKPLSYDRAEARAMVDACREHGCLVFVNYLRRVDPGVREIGRRLADGRISRPIKGVAWYTNGLVHNGSHFVNLLEFWLGPVTDFRIIDAGGMWQGDDPEPDVRMEFASGSVTLLSARGARISHHEIQLVAPNGCLRYEQGGARIAWQAALADPVLGEYTVLGATREDIRSESGRLLWHVADNVSVCLKGAASDLCSGDDALRTLETVLDMKAAL
jgi:predicted dehydrogenase